MDKGFNRILSICFAVVITLSSPSVISAQRSTVGPQVVFVGGESEYEQGAIKIGKTVEQVSDEKGFVKDLFDITLTVDTTEDVSLVPVGKVSTVLVLDISNSMELDLNGVSVGGPGYDPTTRRLDILKRETKKFVDEYAENTKGIVAELALVLFNTDAVVALDWGDISDESFIQKVDNTIDELVTDRNLRNGKRVLVDYTNIRDPIKYEDGTSTYDIWYTNLEAALTLADKLVVDSKQDRPSNDVMEYFVVTITDGKPTRKGGTLEESSERYGLPAVFGMGTGSRSYLPESSDQLQSIITTSQALRQNAEFYCIFLATKKGIDSDFGTGASSIYAPQWFVDNNVATATMYASDESSLEKDLSSIIDNIATIKRLSQSWTVTDPMGEYIELIGAVDSQGSVNSVGGMVGTKAVNISNNTLIWDLKGINNSALNGRYLSSFVYRIKLTASSGNVYDTNDLTTISYALKTTDNAGNPIYGDVKLAQFLIPKVTGDVDIPQTGNNDNLSLLALICLVSLVAVIIILRPKKDRHNR